MDRSASGRKPRIAVFTVHPHPLHVVVRIGLVRYARSHGRWDVFLQQCDPVVPAALLREGKFDAVVVEVFRRDQVEALIASGIPAVNLCTPIDRLPFPQVVPDDDVICELAFNHLRSRGLRSFAVAASVDFPCVLIRLARFKALAAAHSLPCAEIHLPESIGPAEAKDLRTWVRNLPKPVGVFGTRDVEARGVIDACLENGIAVPDEVAVLGVDNDQTLCEALEPPLTSIDLGPDRIGHEVGRLLDRLLAGDAEAGNDVLVPPGELIVRRSSDVVAVADPAVSTALRFIRDQASRSIGVPDLLSLSGMSRRALERRFRESLGRSPAEEICRVRIDRAKALLTQTRLPVSEIALLCGFASANYFTNAFSREVGMSPSAYQQR